QKWLLSRPCDHADGENQQQQSRAHYCPKVPVIRIWVKDRQVRWPNDFPEVTGVADEGIAQAQGKRKRIKTHHGIGGSLGPHGCDAIESRESEKGDFFQKERT